MHMDKNYSSGDYGWKLHAKVSGKTVINLPDKFNELYLLAESSSLIDRYTIIVPYDVLTNDVKRFAGGLGYSGNYTCLVEFNVSQTTAVLNSYVNFNNDETNNATVTVLYR